MIVFNRALTLTRHPVPATAQGPDMEFEWDEDKRLKVLEKHGIDFNKAGQIFQIRHIILAAKSEVEPRFIVVGFLNDEWIAVVFTYRGKACRLITARKARENERRAYRSVHN